jgi:hypothetical protein
LACDEAEEAKTLIASLADKRTDQELQSILEHVRQIMAKKKFFLVILMLTFLNFVAA